MAKEIRIKMDIEGNAVDALKNIQKAYDDINKSAENAKKATEGIAGSPAIKPSVGADMNLNPTGKYYKQQQRKDREEMLSMAMAGDTTSESFIKLQEKTGNLRDTQDELNNRLKYFAQSGAEQAATALAEGVGVLGSTAQIAIGSMELLGISNEEATKTVAKLASVEAVMNGVKQISIALQSDSMFMLGLENAKMKALAFTTSAYNAVVGSSIGLLKGMKLALAGTGIGLAVVAVGMLANAWMDVNAENKKYIKGEEDSQQKQNTQYIQTYNDIQSLKEEYKGLEIQRLRAFGKNEEADKLELRNQQNEIDIIKNDAKNLNDAKENLEKQQSINKKNIDELKKSKKDQEELFAKNGGFSYTEDIRYTETTKQLNKELEKQKQLQSAIGVVGQEIEKKQNQLRNEEAKKDILGAKSISRNTVSKQKQETVQASAPKNFTLNIAELGRIDQVNIMSDEDEKAFQQRLVNAVMSAMTTAQARVAR